MFRSLWLLPICALSLLAQQSPPPGGSPPGGRGDMFANPKNLKVLKPEELREAMNMARSGLGVRCTYCHVRGDFASDSIDKKVVARTMFQMVAGINTNTFNVNAFDGQAKVTCFTCHRGAEMPVSTPPSTEHGPDEAPPAGTPPPPGTPAPGTPPPAK
jgi:photosynthetic reaction center cytochrome c subunit